MAARVRCGLSTAEQRCTFRQGAQSWIVTAAHGINRGAIPDLSLPEGETDFYFGAAEGRETTVSRIVELVRTRIPRRFGLDPVRERRVLCPMNRGNTGARFEGRDLLYGFGELDALVPAYAATVHKSQGSEYPAVVSPVLTQHYALLKRDLLYTGVTRGKGLAGATAGAETGIVHQVRSLRERPLTGAMPHG